MPGYANPQALNRYSYVLGNPLKYIDPSGHGQCQTQEDCADMGTTPMGTGGTGGGSNSGGSGSGSPHDDDDFDPNPNGFIAPVTTCAQDDFSCLLYAAIDGEFDPYSAFIPGNGINTDLAIYYNSLAYEAYSMSGYDLNMIAKLGINNPMTVYDFADAGVPIEWIEMTSPGRRTPGQAFFMQVMRLDFEHITNYEPNYLHAVMLAHPDELEQAKQSYYVALIDVAEDVETAYELFILRDDLIGPFDAP